LNAATLRAPLKNIPLESDDRHLKAAARQFCRPLVEGATGWQPWTILHQPIAEVRGTEHVAQVPLAKHNDMVSQLLSH
jgi:hypothetical protein